jgi:UDP-glucose 4-epimerase
MVMKVMGKELPIRYVEARKEVMHAYSDHTKVKKVFNIKDHELIGLEEGLTKMANWVLKVGSRQSSDFKNIEIPIGLPKIWTE